MSGTAQVQFNVISLIIIVESRIMDSLTPKISMFYSPQNVIVASNGKMDFANVVKLRILM